jgi:alanine racemase
MDLIAVELPNKKVKLGDDIILWGKDLKVDELASLTDNIPYSFMTSLSKRVNRKYIK